MTDIVENVEFFAVSKSMQAMQVEVPICIEKNINEINALKHASDASPTGGVVRFACARSPLGKPYGSEGPKIGLGRLAIVQTPVALGWAK